MGEFNLNFTSHGSKWPLSPHQKLKPLASLRTPSRSTSPSRLTSPPILPPRLPSARMLPSTRPLTTAMPLSSPPPTTVPSSKVAKYGWLDCQEGSMKWTTGYTDAKCTLPATGRVEDADWTLTLDKAKEGKGNGVAAVGKDIGWKASYTAAGWTAAAANNSSDANNTSNNSSNATGAKSLAAAVAAGALAVVATQF